MLLNDATLADEYATPIAVEIVTDGKFVIFAGIFSAIVGGGNKR